MAKIDRVEFKQAEMGQIPKEWEVVRLENVIKEIRNGFASGKRDDNGIVQIRMNNVTTDGHLIFDSFLKVPIPENINEFLLKENDFLFNNTNSIDLVGKSTIFKKAPFPCTFSNHFTRIRFTKDVLPELVLFHFIKLWRKGFFKSVAIRHVGQSAVQTKFITNIHLPLPLLPEQRKIAEVLSTADEVIQKVDEAIERTERLKKGLMQELLTKGIGHAVGAYHDTPIGMIPKGWEVVRMGDEDIADLIMGQSPPSSTYNDKKTGLPFLQGNAEFGEMYPTPVLSCSQPTKLSEKNDILLSVRAPVGDVNITPHKLCIGRGLAAIRPKRNNLDYLFLFYYLKFGSRIFESLSMGSTFKAIRKEEVVKFQLPLPPLPEQQKISEILSTVDKKLELLREKKERFEMIKKGLMEDLLTGKKRVIKM